jgi:hypothetical protein
MSSVRPISRRARRLDLEDVNERPVAAACGLGVDRCEFSGIVPKPAMYPLRDTQDLVDIGSSGPSPSDPQLQATAHVDRCAKADFSEVDRCLRNPHPEKSCCVE